MKALTWNLEWARPGSRREHIIRNELASAGADLICLTEAFRSTFPPDGEIIEAGEGNRVADRLGARKVLLWSRNGWDDVSIEPSFEPAGRIISGVTGTSFGPVRVFGLCIPWLASNTRRFGGTRRPWEDHLGFVRALKARLRGAQGTTIIIGDFNQRLPRVRQPKVVAQALEDALEQLVLSTRGFASAAGDLTIDHIAHSPNLRLEHLTELPRERGGIQVSDHFGVAGVIDRA